MILIRNPKSYQEYLDACLHIEQVYQMKGFVEHLEGFPNILFLAFKIEKLGDPGVMVGAIGLQQKGVMREGSSKITFDAEHYFGCEKIQNRLGIDFADSSIVEIMRLAKFFDVIQQKKVQMEGEPLVEALIGAVCRWVGNYQKKLMIAVMKSQTAAIVEKKIPVKLSVVDARLCEENIPQNNYFLDQKDPPQFHFVFSQTILNAMTNFIMDLMSKQKIVFDFNGHKGFEYQTPEEIKKSI